LFVGTPKDNSIDMAAKGRTVTSRKVSDEDVATILARIADGTGYPASLAREFGVSEGTIRGIRDRVRDYARGAGIEPGPDAL